MKSNRRRFRIGPAQVGRRIDRILRAEHPNLPYGRIQRLFRENQVRLNGRSATPDQRARDGDEIAILGAAGLNDVPPNPAVPFDVMHEDEHLIVVAKPSGLAVHPGPKQKTRTLLSGLLHRFDADLRPLGKTLSYGLAHRLDRDTSGVLVVARTADAHRDLLEQFRRRLVSKEYRALVAGAPPRAAGTIQLPLQRVEHKGRTRIRVATGDRGLRAVTGYRLLETFRKMSYLEIKPRTGRTHQIRVHLADFGTPVAGDRLYGTLTANEYARHHLGLGRLFLHALKLSFTHPGTGRAFSVEAPLPSPLEAVLARVRQDAKRPD